MAHYRPRACARTACRGTPGGDDDDATLTLTLTLTLTPTLTLTLTPTLTLALALTLIQVRRLTEPSDLFAEAPPKAK